MIKLKNVSYTYEKQEVFRNLSLSVERGEKVGILGESGCGKSTLLKIIAGLYKPTEGTVLVDGVNMPPEINKKVSIVMQSPMLLPLTILENITMGHDYPEDWIEKVIDAANLRGWIDTLAEGVNTYLGDRADELSGGQAQRIAIARAMCKDAEILLLDEPTSALDGENAAAILEAIDRYSVNKTVIHVTHRPEHLKGYDRVFIMKEGKLDESYSQKDN
jgi:ABC-type bacteriocin/lantibiotic exporters, contain an N-terminal double-glycine peptidase domain